MKCRNLVQMNLFYKKTKFTFLKSISILKHHRNKCQYFFEQNFGKVYFDRNLLERESPTLRKLWKFLGIKYSVSRQ